MPKVRQDIAVIAGIPHTPKDRGPHCDMHVVNVEYGSRLLYLVRDVQLVQREARKVIPMAHSVQPGTAEDALEWIAAGSPSLYDPEKDNPLSQIEGLADSKAQSAMEALDGDTSGFESYAPVAMVVDRTNQAGSDMYGLQQVAESARVVADAVENGTVEELAALVDAARGADPGVAAHLVQGLRVASSRASIRSSRAASRAATQLVVDQREASRRARGGSKAAQREGFVPSDSSAKTSMPSPFRSSVVAGGGSVDAATTTPAPTALVAPSPSTTTDNQAPDRVVDAPEPVEVKDEPAQEPATTATVPGVREDIYQAIIACDSPDKIVVLYDSTWTQKEVDFARQTATELTAILSEAAHEQIRACFTRSQVAALWETWWPDDLVEFAREFMTKLPA